MTARKITTTRYPWDRWFHSKRKKFKLVRDVDYFCMSHVMAAQIRNYASKQGRSVTVIVGEGTVTLTVKD